MTRKDIIYNALRTLSEDVTIEDLREELKIGFDAETISNFTNIGRSNASRELNQLVRERRVLKIEGRPVRFIEKEKVDKLLSIDYEGDCTFGSFEDFVAIFTPQSPDSMSNDQDPFEKIIGYKGSLELVIKQAKAAMLYPPKGLHTLITGATGVGKTTFADIMHKYAGHVGTINKEGKFVIFNCSEYAENPQLILSQLFGHKKGSFTGAEEDKAGLIEKADGGILLLDEIHRLPPEGQEMLFLLMDKNIFRRLGETDGYRKANVLIIGATTEDINSILLGTFLRRIPMVINLPSLDKRPLSERLEFIETFFLEEVNNVNVPIKVYRDVLRAFLLYDCKGNIGQLKGDIQLLCARGFLDYKTYNKREIEIDTPFLPEHIYNGLLSYNKKREELLNLLGHEKDYYIFRQSNKAKLITIDDYNLSDNLYDEITEKYNHYNERGFSEVKINEIISRDIEGYLKKLLKRCNTKKDVPDKEELFKIVSPRVYNAVEVALIVAEQKLERKFKYRTVVGLAMHISALMERIVEGKTIYNEEINKIAINNPNEFGAAKVIREILQQELEIEIPKEEVGFLTMFLSTVDLEEEFKKIGVIVLAHGESTASSVGKVVNSLLGTDHCNAIDMPLDVKVEDILEITIKKVKAIDEGKGVFLLVDMGSLTAFPEIIYKKTGIITSSVETISTPVVIEAVRKSLLPEMTLSSLTDEIKSVNPYIGRMVSGDLKNKVDILDPKIVLTTCVTGQGAAIKIAHLLENALPFIQEYNIKIKPVDIINKFNINSVLSAEEIKNVVAVVGTIDLCIPDVIFIPIDELIIGDGIKVLEKAIIGIESSSIVKERASDENMFVNVLEKMLTFLNPTKAYNLINKSFVTLINLLGIKDTKQLKVRYIFHCCCMVERLLQNDILPYQNIEDHIQRKSDMYKKIKLSLINVEEVFGIVIPDTEIGYIIDLFDTL